MTGAGATTGGAAAGGAATGGATTGATSGVEAGGAATGGAVAGGAMVGGAMAGATSGAATGGAATGGAREATIARRDAASASRTPRASKRLRCCLSWARLIWDMMAKAGCPSEQGQGYSLIVPAKDIWGR
ncbi:hypothetical protein GUJ93_ZPchr0005g15633 [Zizania palustris]|uniref:Uncharacterized protein n=1 Tax=Zizania palustris TaxID=103762 RepID=A0A8J5VG44_ZIZPA|nr:hypothetical protein GUJ93_ZPchr0005g15633 [Zizania palustris]